MISVFDRVENIVGKGENAGYLGLLYWGRYKSGLRVKELTSFYIHIPASVTL